MSPGFSVSIAANESSAMATRVPRETQSVYSLPKYFSQSSSFSMPPNWTR